MDELEELLSNNRIWKERTVGVGLVTAQQAWCVAGRRGLAAGAGCVQFGEASLDTVRALTREPPPPLTPPPPPPPPRAGTGA